MVKSMATRQPEVSADSRTRVRRLVLTGLDLVVTGALSHCPQYRKLGYVPPSLRNPT